MVSVKLHQGELCGLDLGALSVFHAVPYAKAARFQAPDLAPQKLLSLLIDTSPESPGKWLATAKTLGQLEVAEQLIWQSN